MKTNPQNEENQDMQPGAISMDLDPATQRILDQVEAANVKYSHHTGKRFVRDDGEWQITGFDYDETPYAVRVVQNEPQRDEFPAEWFDPKTGNVKC